MILFNLIKLRKIYLKFIEMKNAMRTILSWDFHVIPMIESQFAREKKNHEINN